MAAPSSTEYGPVRTPLNFSTLKRYIETKVEGFKLADEVFQFNFGQSNPTYLLRSSTNNKHYVVRTRPPGPLISKTAHAIDREFRVLKALHEDGSVPVPKVYHLCKDESVIGRQWYLMEYLAGRKFEDVRMPEVKTKEDRETLWLAILKTLAALHALDPKKIGLGDYGSSAAFYPRQIRSLSKVSAAQAAVTSKKTGKQVGDIPGIDFLLDWYGENLPREEGGKLEARVIHGDFKVDNMIFHPTEPRVIGVLDWELSTLGHPYSDLANLLQPFYVPSETKRAGHLVGLRDIPSSSLPIPSAPVLLQAWCERMGEGYVATMEQGEGRNRWEGCVSFAFFRLAVITQGIAARHAQGNASSARAGEYAQLFPMLGHLSVEHIERYAGGKDEKAIAKL
ncbi:hypothetical protein JCM8547_004016 [Rhodosporidiobolus lusitaniae]